MRRDYLGENAHSRKGNHRCARVCDSNHSRHSGSLLGGLCSRLLLILMMKMMTCRSQHNIHTTGGVGDIDMIVPSLRVFHDALSTTSRQDFGDNEEVFRAVVERHHTRLRAGAWASSGGWGTFVAITGHAREGRRAREMLTTAFSDTAVRTAAIDQRHGMSFLVHANIANVEVFLAREAGMEDVKGGGEQGGTYYSGDGSSQGTRLFDGFFALPPELKLSPSLLYHGLSDGNQGNVGATVTNSSNSTEAGIEGMGTGPWSTVPGKSLNERGLVVLLSPGCDNHDGGGEPALVQRWRQEWSSELLNLRDLSYWSSFSEGVQGTTSTHPPEDSSPYSALLTREWSSAAVGVHSMAKSLGVTPAEACGWNSVKVALEAPGLITVRGIGHLLPRQADSEENRLEKEDGRVSQQQSPSCLMGLISFLASRPEAVRVSALPRGQLFNAVAARIVQGASLTTTPLWDRGVDGTDQVVQVVDSGVAERSCYFTDSADGADLEHGYLKDADGTLGSGDFPSDTTRRKVVQYIEGVEGESDFTSDDSTGHGSHVAGSIAGSLYDDWTGPADCPVGDATDDQTSLSCVGKCMSPTELSDAMSNRALDIDALCPDYDCDSFWEDECLSNNRSVTLRDGQGMAPGAKLAVLDVGTSSSSDQVLGGHMWEASFGTGAMVHSGSWGFPDEPCTVDEATVSFDTWAYENPEHLLVFAAGNLGDDMTGCSVSSPALGKNCLAVGTTESGELRFTTDIDQVSDFSSRGLTTDGRVKPDIVAPGHFVLSVSNGGDGSCELTINSGTSMSCPVVSGSCALVRQYFDGGFYAADVAARGDNLCSSSSSSLTSSFYFPCEGFSPSGALVKAMIIHGANAMGGSSDPDGERGFGRVHLEAAMPFDGEDLWALYVEDDDGSTSGKGQVEALAVEERAFLVTEEDAEAAVVAGTEDGPGGIRVTLVWMDYPATTLASSQLVHDLDLILEGPDGRFWTMSGECTGDQSTCSLDSANNVERIVVPASEVTSGIWTVRVSAEKDLSEGGPQSFGLAVSLPISAGSGGGPFSNPSPSTPSSSDTTVVSDTPTPTLALSEESTPGPSTMPVPETSPEPTVRPSAVPVFVPSVAPVAVETPSPTDDPTVVPSVAPMDTPTVDPTVVPSVAPITTQVPSYPSPSLVPSVAPIDTQTVDPTVVPSVAPITTQVPSSPGPSLVPSVAPMNTPTVDPTVVSSVAPETATPSRSPSLAPSVTTSSLEANQTAPPSLDTSLVLSVAPETAPPSSAPSLMPSEIVPTSSPSVVMEATDGPGTVSPSSMSSLTNATFSPSSDGNSGGTPARAASSSEEIVMTPSPESASALGSDAEGEGLSGTVRSALPGMHSDIVGVCAAFVFFATSTWLAAGVGLGAWVL